MNKVFKKNKQKKGVPYWVNDVKQPPIVATPTSKEIQWPTYVELFNLAA